MEEQGADEDAADEPVAVEGRQRAHILFGRGRRQRGDRRAEQDFSQSGRYRKQYGPDHQADIRELRKQRGDQGVNAEPRSGDERHEADRPVDIEMPAKEAENQVDSELRAEIDQHQRAQKRIGNAVQFPEGREQERRQAEY